MLLTLELLLILTCLFYGARKGGVALGLLGGVGVVMLVFVFHVPPGKPPVDVMLTIVAVVAASATLQSSGGLEVLLLLAEKVLRRNPKYVSILAPFVTTFLTMLCGTGHVVYTMLPIISRNSSPTLKTASLSMGRRRRCWTRNSKPVNGQRCGFSSERSPSWPSSVRSKACAHSSAASRCRWC